MANYNLFSEAIGAFGTFKTKNNNYVVAVRSQEKSNGESITKCFPVVMNFGSKITAKFPKDFSEDEMSKYTEYLQIGMKDTSYPSIGYTRGIIYPSAEDLNYQKDYPLDEFIPRVMSPGIEDVEGNFYAKEINNYYKQNCNFTSRKCRDFSKSLLFKEFEELVRLRYPKFKQKNYKIPSWGESLLDGMMHSDRFFILQGPPGTGKTDTSVSICIKLGVPCEKTVGDGDLSKQLGHVELVPNGENSNKTIFVRGSLANCYKHGGVFIVDEANFLPPKVAVILNEMTDGSPTVIEAETGEILERHENFMIIFTLNPGARGAQKMLESLANRENVSIFVPALTIDEMVERILFSHPNIGKDFVVELAKSVGIINNFAKQVGSTGTCTVRQLDCFCERLNCEPISFEDFLEQFNHRVTNVACGVNISSIDKPLSIEGTEEYKDFVSKIFSKYKFKKVLGTDFEWIINSRSNISSNNTIEGIVDEDVDSILNGIKGMVK